MTYSQRITIVAVILGGALCFTLGFLIASYLPRDTPEPVGHQHLDPFRYDCLTPAEKEYIDALTAIGFEVTETLNALNEQFGSTWLTFDAGETSKAEVHLYLEELQDQATELEEQSYPDDMEAVHEEVKLVSGSLRNIAILTDLALDGKYPVDKRRSIENINVSRQHIGILAEITASLELDVCK